MGIRSRETSGWQSPAVGGVHWAVGWGSPEKKLGGGEGARGMAGAAADRWWGVVSGRAGWPRAAGDGGSASGGWRLRGEEFDNKLEALDFGSNGWKI